MLKKQERLALIVEVLNKQDISSIKELTKILGMSEMTARRDVESLKEQGIISSFYGGISLNKNVDLNADEDSYNVDKELSKKTDQKIRIAKKAASLIDPNDVVLIDSGSTTAAIIDYIPNEYPTIIYCFALNILNGVCRKDNLNVVMCGGYFHRNTKMFAGEEGVQTLRNASINKAFMATRGVTKEMGVTTAESYEKDIKSAALSASEQRILLVDSSKLGKAWYTKYADLEDFDVIITDSEIDKKYIAMIEEAGITLHIV